MVGFLNQVFGLLLRASAHGSFWTASFALAAQGGDGPVPSIAGGLEPWFEHLTLQGLNRFDHRTETFARY